MPQVKGFKLFTIKGVPVKFSYWELGFLGLGFLPFLVLLIVRQDLNSATEVGLPLAFLTLGLTLSTLIHELAHAFVGLAFGSKVVAIQLHILGGATYFAERAPAYFKDILIFLAGPLSNVGLWGLLQWLANSMGNSSFSGTITYLASLNLVLALFNALPAFPLDGGQAAYAFLMGLTFQPKFAARTVMVLSLSVAVLLVFGPRDYIGLYRHDLINDLLLWYLAFWIVTSTLALQSHANSIVNFYPAGEAQFQQHRQQAGKWAEQNHAEPFFAKGQAQFEAGQYELALGSFVQALEAAPDELIYLEKRAATFVKLEEYSQALLDYTALLKKTSGQPQIYTARAFVHKKMGQPGQARADLEQALRLNPVELPALLLEAELNQVFAPALPHPMTRGVALG